MSFEDQMRNQKVERQKEYSSFLAKQVQLKRHHSSDHMSEAERKMNAG